MEFELDDTSFPTLEEMLLELLKYDHLFYDEIISELQKLADQERILVRNEVSYD